MSQLMDSFQLGSGRIRFDRRLQGAAVGLVALGLIWAVTQWAATPAWVTAFSALDLETSSSIISTLDGERVEYRLERGGTEILVRDSELARTRVLVASEGLLPLGRPGLELFDRPAWGMTDFTERVNYRRALEGELERTLLTMSSISSAKVHLALPATSLFAQTKTALEASVVIAVRRPALATDELILGVRSLVASAVDGLTAENVTVVDESGRVFATSAGGEGLSGTGGISPRQMEMKEEVERRLTIKATDLIAQAVGPGNSEVSLSVDLDFDQIVRTTQSLAAENEAQLTVGEAAGQAVQSVEQFTSASGTIKRMTVAVLLNARRVRQSDGSVRIEPRSRQELDQIESLVRNAIGLDEGRGDAITIVSVPFVRAAAPKLAGPEGLNFMSILEAAQRPVLWLLAVGLGLRVLTLVLAHLRTAPPMPRGQGAAPLPSLGSAPGVVIPGQEVSAAAFMIPEEPILTADDIVRKRAASQVVKEPEVAARVVRAWMKEA